MDDVRPLPREHGDVVLAHPDAVRQRGTWPRDPDRIEVRDLIVAGLALHRLQLEGRFGSVRMNRGSGSLRQIARRPEQRPSAARREPRGKAIAQPSAGGAMPFSAQVRALRKRLVGRLAQCRGTRGRIHQALPRRRADADRLECLERGARVTHGLHVENRRRAAEQQLRGAEHRGGVNGGFGVRGLEWPDALREPRLERQIVGEPAEERLTEVDVRLYETRKHDEAVTIDRGGFWPPIRPSAHPPNAYNA